MSSVYTPTAVALGNITIPIGSDARTATSITAPLQAVADGVLHVQNRTDALADLTALAAITTPTDGLVRTVELFGTYVFDSGYSTTDSPWSIAAADATPGRWRHVLSTLRGGASGLAGLDASSRVEILGAGWPVFEAGSRSRTIAVPMHSMLGTEGNVTRAKSATFSAVGIDAAYCSLINGRASFANAPGAALSQGIIVCLDPWLHDGATLSQVTMQLEGAAGHVGLPATQASFGVFRVPKLSLGFTSLLAAGDWLTDSQASTAAYEASHALTMTPDQNNVIDRSAYSYYAQAFDEFGANSAAGLSIYGFELTLSSIADMRPA